MNQETVLFEKGDKVFYKKDFTSRQPNFEIIQVIGPGIGDIVGDNGESFYRYKIYNSFTEEVYIAPAEELDHHVPDYEKCEDAEFCEFSDKMIKELGEKAEFLKKVERDISPYLENLYDLTQKLTDISSEIFEIRRLIYRRFDLKNPIWESK